MRNLLTLIAVSLLMIPLVGSAQTKAVALHPPTYWVQSPLDSEAYQGFYPEQYIAEIMNMLMKADSSTKIEMSIYYVEKKGHIKAQLESGETDYRAFHIMKMLLDSLPHFDPAIAIDLKTLSEYRDTLNVGILRHNNKSEIYVVRRSMIEKDKDENLLENESEIGIIMPTFMGGDPPYV